MVSSAASGTLRTRSPSSRAYDASRAIFDENRPTGAAASSYSPGVEKALAIIGPVP